MEVAVQLSAHDALATHARDELNINENTQANTYSGISHCLFIYSRRRIAAIGFHICAAPG
jgi:hypothetical protein